MGHTYSRFMGRAPEPSETLPGSQDEASCVRPTLSDTDEEDARSIKSMSNKLSELFETAVHETTGWARKDIDTELDLSELLMDLGHWKSSVALFACTESSSQDNGEFDTPMVYEFLETLETKEKFLAGTIRMYLDLSIDSLQSLHAIFVNDDPDSE